MSASHATLHYIHDPLCGWCYGAQPLVSAAVAMLGDRLALRLHGGALFAEPQELTPAMAEHIVRADERIEEISGQPFGDAERHVDVRAIRDDRELGPLAAERRAADRDWSRSPVGQRLFDPWISIQRDVFVIQHGIRIRDGRRHESSCV